MLVLDNSLPSVVVATVVGLALFGLEGCDGPTPPPPGPAISRATQPDLQPPSTPPKMTQAFEPAKSQNPKFGQGRADGSFYIALQVVDKRTGVDDSVCLDQTFLSWARSFVATGAADVAVVAHVTDPAGNKPLNVPLFSTSRSEAAPPNCNTKVTSQQITPYYLAYALHPFLIGVDVNADEATNSAIVTDTIQAAKSAFAFAGHNGNLVNVLGGTALTNIATAMDAKISANLRLQKQTEYSFEVGAFPNKNVNSADDDWNNFNDSVLFGTQNIKNSVWRGPVVAGEILPTVEIVPTYAISLFGGGEGKYDSVDKILAQKLVPGSDQTLADELVTKMPGVSLMNAQGITDPGELDRLCGATRNQLNLFLTDDDALAARYAILAADTHYLTSMPLRASSHCLNETEIARLKKLNSDFVVPDLIQNEDNRNAAVDNLSYAVAHAFLNAKKGTDFNALVTDASKFQLFVSNDVAGNFPSNIDGKPLSATGADAENALPALGVTHVGCGVAPTGQSLNMVVTVALTKASATPVAMEIVFNGDAAAASDSTKIGNPISIQAIKFLPMQTAQDLVNGVPFPGKRCDLAT